MRDLRARAPQAVQVSLVPKILVSSELWIVALGLEDDADVAPQCAWIGGCIESLNDCMPASGEHQRRENSEKCCLTASIGPKQPEQLRITDFESDAIERSTVIVAVNEILNADNGTGAGPTAARGAASSRTGTLLATDHSTQSFYDDTVLSIMRANRSGR